MKNITIKKMEAIISILPNGSEIRFPVVGYELHEECVIVHKIDNDCYQVGMLTDGTGYNYGDRGEYTADFLAAGAAISLIDYHSTEEL